MTRNKNLDLNRRFLQNDRKAGTTKKAGLTKVAGMTLRIKRNNKLDKKFLRVRVQ